MKKKFYLNESMLHQLVKEAVKRLQSDDDDMDFKEKDTGDHDFDNEGGLDFTDGPTDDDLLDLGFDDDDDDEFETPIRGITDRDPQVRLGKALSLGTRPSDIALVFRGADDPEVYAGLRKELKQKANKLKMLRSVYAKKGITSDEGILNAIDKSIDSTNQLNMDDALYHNRNDHWLEDEEDDREFFRSSHFMNESTLRNIVKGCITQILKEEYKKQKNRL